MSNNEKDKKTIDSLIITTKTNIKNIIKNVKLSTDITIHEQLNEVVYRVNKIVVHTYQFLKLYLLYLYDKKEEFPIINVIFIRAIMRIVSVRKDNRGKPPNNETKIIMIQLEKFYKNFYKKTIINEEQIYDDKLGSILEWEALDMITNIENNISEHFINNINRLVNCSYNSKEEVSKLNKLDKPDDVKKQLVKDYYAELRKIKNDIISISDNYTSNKKYHEWINKHRKYIVPNKQNFSKKIINYDVCVIPQDYLKSYIYINNELKKLSTEEKELKLFHVIPLRTSIVPKNITLDTSGLARLFVEDGIREIVYDIKKNKKKVWNKFFKLNNKVFKKNKKRYTFQGMIKTDGISCSILFTNTINNIPLKVTTYKQKKITEIIDTYDKRHIEDETDKKIVDELKTKKIVAIDPGHSDIIMCLSKENINNTIISTNKKGNIIKKHNDGYTKFRYTQAQRNSETRNKKYLEIIDSINNNKKIDDKTIKEIESELSKNNSKTCDFKEFTEYLKVKNKINYILFNHYKETIHRKLKFNRYINTQKSESKMIKNFKNAFGDQKEVLIVMGDYSGKNMKGKEPTICKKLRKIFRRNKYNTYLINEHNTSKLCHKCEHENENFLKRRSNNPKHNGKEILVWGLVRCKNIKCKLIQNRDINACKNMLKIVKSLFDTGERPKKYKRQVPAYNVVKTKNNMVYF